MPDNLLKNINPKNAYIARLLMQGTDTGPVQHWTQGAARLAQALAGGAHLRDMEQKQESQAQTVHAARMSAPELQRQLPPAPSAPQMAPPMAPPPRRQVSVAPGNDPAMTFSPGEIQSANAQPGQVTFGDGQTGNDPRMMPPPGPAMSFNDRFQPAGQGQPGATPVQTQSIQPPKQQQPPHQGGAMPSAQAEYVRRLLDTRDPELVKEARNIQEYYRKLQEESLSSVVIGEQGYTFNRRNGQYTLGPSAAKPPAGYDRGPNGTLVATPGGPATHVPAEVAGRLAMMETAQRDFAKARITLMKGRGEYGYESVADRARSAANIGEIGQANRTIRLGVEAALRVMTGANAPEQEVRRYADQFTPSQNDNADTAKQKLDNLENFMNAARATAMQGRGGVAPPSAAPSSGGGNADPLGIRR
jgi:hypothetical protein